VTGIGYQWDGKHAIADAATLFPEKKLMQTESECGNGSNDKAAGMYTYGLLCHYLKRGANSYIYWNMVLDRGGYSTWSWAQNALITIDRKVPAVIHNFEYHVLRHISRFVPAGARRLLTTGKDEHSLAFLTPDGNVVIVVQNPRYTVMDLRLRLGDRMFCAQLPPETLHTFVLGDANPTAG
jgi:glucosylceramidase